MAKTETYVRLDESSVMRVGKTRVMMDSVVAAFQQGHSPETIQQEYPALTLEEVYGALAYYLANRDEVDRYLTRQGEIWNELREKSGQASNPVVQRLRGVAAHAAAQVP
jgi:uncharacterized protein (DUF433 family)